MKVLKFTLDQELPEIIYLEETLGLGDSKVVSESTALFSEILGLGDSFKVIFQESFTDTIGLGDSHLIILPHNIIETFGLGDILYQYDYVEISEQLGLGDGATNTMDIYVTVDETIGFADSGYSYLVMDYELKWRTRTKKSTYGSGAAPYGDQTTYGDGDVIGELKEFKIKVIRISDSTTLRTDTITIVNKNFPDGSAQYIYTSSMNTTDNGYFEPNLRFEVYQVDINDVWSPADHLDITATLYKGDFE
jgi:hypothetical protein